MFLMFNRFKKTIHIRGKPDERAVFTRQGRSITSNFKNNFVSTILLQENTRLENGDLFEVKLDDGWTKFLVVSVRRGDLSVQGVVYRCNGEAEILRPVERYDENDNLCGTDILFVAKVPVNHMIINDYMRMTDPGLLPSVTKEFRMQKCDVRLLDRLVVDGDKFVVDAIDNTKFDGLLAVQTSVDNREF